MDNEKLQKMTEYISITVFERPFKHSAYFNKRLRTTGGRYILNTHNIETVSYTHLTLPTIYSV